VAQVIKTPRLLCKLCSQQPVCGSISKEINPTRTTLPYLFKIQFHIKLPSKSFSSHWPFSVCNLKLQLSIKFVTQFFMCIYILTIFLEQLLIYLIIIIIFIY